MAQGLRLRKDFRRVSKPPTALVPSTFGAIGRRRGQALETGRDGTVIRAEEKVRINMDLLLRKLTVGGGKENVINLGLRAPGIAPGEDFRASVNKAVISEQQSRVDFTFIRAGGSTARLNGSQLIVSVNCKSEHIEVPTSTKELVKLIKKALPDGEAVASLSVGEMRAN